MPMDKSRYPADWKMIALRVKNIARWRCQACLNQCRRPGEPWDEFVRARYGALSDYELSRPGRFILTVAHLDQDPSNNAPGNLLALCAPCHLRYDARYREANSRAKRERAGQLSLLDGASDDEGGSG